MTKTSWALAALLILSVPLPAARKKAAPFGTVISISGKVDLLGVSDRQARTLKLGAQIFPGDRIKTAANGRVQLVLVDGTQLKVNYLTDLVLHDTDVKGRQVERGVGSIKLFLGILWAKVSAQQSRLEFETPSAVAAVKGTEPLLEVNEKGDLCARLREGKLDLSSELGSASLSELQQICIKKGVKFGQNDVKSWEGSGASYLWTQEIGGSTATEVILKVKGKDGQTREVQVEYEKP